jgi:hypothetical protein
MNGTCRSWWGYKNNGTSAVTINIGANNMFSPPPQNSGEPITFQVGEFHYVFFIDKNCSTIYNYTIDGNTVTGTSASNCIGGCCNSFPTFTICTTVTQANCLAGSGTFKGPVTDCSNYCPQPTIFVDCPTNNVNASAFAVLGNNTVTGSALFLTPTIVNGGSVGSNVAVNGFFTITGGNTQVLTPNTISGNAQAVTLYNYINSLPCTQTITTLSIATTFNPGVICLTGILSISVALTFDRVSASAFPLPYFYIKVQGPITLSAVTMTTINGALPCDIYWVGNQAIGTGAVTTVLGTVISPTGISLGLLNTINGRIWSTAGTVLLQTSTINNCVGSTCTLGTCCILTTTTCMITNVTSCSSMNGTFTLGANCNSTLTCTLPLVSCCLTDDTCQLLNVTTCSSMGGISNTSSSTCSVGQCFKGRITPIVGCVTNYNNGTCSVPFGYNNTGGTTSISIGLNNEFNIGGINQGQPTTFLAGYNPNVFSIFYACNLSPTWNIDNKNATINSSLICNAGACCSAINQTCSYVNSTQCASLGGSFNLGLQCNNTICQLNITRTTQCFGNYYNGSCTIYFSYFSYNQLPITVPIGPNNYMSLNGTFTDVISGDLGQPTIFNPGLNLFSISQINCTSYMWWLSTGG